ncbi:uncharacterized protein B0I36DRAFT_314649 [Microdochium trichocladiopsis]|uniref:DUF7704 domain-containing protein n=1 Tax=Microdochium trichocladiopsis TaxID=1682393 RepID=A0A9P9BSA4_9PEZI|nr:uncharacterized protein B0I36DRAFT_314649 [Microdochium trichocladiopsis]KAH7037705.1 hypothetical protein B0I36DRAFT_314649 [Microdochium trichocladiopsis]
MAKPTTAPGTFVLPRAYQVFFLVIEPLAALVGAVYAHFFQEAYLTMTHAPSSPTSSPDGGGIPLGTSVVMSQLANLYLLFTLNEALVLRSTGDLRVWRTVLFVLLVADLGHLYSLRALGGRVYWDVLGWNAIDWGNVPFVYAGASMRSAFLLGVGLGGGGGEKAGVLGKKRA